MKKKAHGKYIKKTGLALLLAVLMLMALLPGSAISALAQAKEPSLNVAYYNLSYSSETFVMYAVRYENVDPDAVQVQMLFWDGPRTDGYVPGTEDRSVSPARKTTINGEKHLVFYSKGLAPKELTDTIYCRAYAVVGNKTCCSDPVKYSPIKYITDLVGRQNTTEADKNLATALREYGAAAQVRFDYHTERLASERFCNLTLHGAHLDDGFSYGIYKAGTELTLTADAPEGDSITVWTDARGNTLGTGPKLTLKLQSDLDVRVSQGTPTDLSSFEGRRFTQDDTLLLPYFFTGGPLTIEAAIRLPTGFSGRGGVIVGNYGVGTETLSLEVYNSGKVRVFLASGERNWSLIFNTDVRSDEIQTLAVTLGNKNGECTLYRNGQAVETKTMPCSVPLLKDTLRLGGDHRSGNTQYFKGTIYSLAIYEGIRNEAGIARDALLGADTDSAALAASYRFATADARTDESRCRKDLCSQLPDGFSPASVSDRYNLTDRFSVVPRTYEAVIETSADVFSNNKGCTIIGNYNDVYLPGISFRVYLNGCPSLCFRYDYEHQDQFTFPECSILEAGKVHVAITVDDTYVYGYLNGTQVLKKAHCGYLPDLNPSPFSIGGDNRTDNTWWFRDGSIYSVNLFSGYRTEEQIRADINYIDTDDPELMLSFDFTRSREDQSRNQNRLVPYFYEKAFLPPENYDYTFACVGDTQSLVKRYPEELHNIYDFLLEHAEDMKIARVIGLGDMTEDNTADQWQLVSDQVYRLDGVLPYTVIRGNHDHFARTEEAEATAELMFGYYFDNDTYRRQYDGSYDGGPTNTYTRFTVCGIPYLMLCLDYGPDDDVLEWASGICEQYPSDNVIVTTHAFLFHDATTIDEHDICPPRSAIGSNNCDEMWDKFVSQHENIVLVLCGHDPCNTLVVSRMTGVHGNTVTSCLINPQHTDYYDRASGLVALLHFSNGGRTITIENYSTVQSRFYKTDNEIVIEDVARVS